MGKDEIINVGEEVLPMSFPKTSINDCSRGKRVKKERGTPTSCKESDQRTTNNGGRGDIACFTWNSLEGRGGGTSEK